VEQNKIIMTNERINNLVEHTNARLITWYANAKRDYGVIGEGFAKFNKETEELEIYYTENGINCLYKHYWHPDFELNTIFDIWQTDANIDDDRI